MSAFTRPPVLRFGHHRRNESPPVAHSMRLTLDHWAMRCASCSKVMIVTMRESDKVLAHVYSCNLLLSGTLEGMRARIRKYAANADVEARSLAVLDRLWRRFESETDDPIWFVTASDDGAIQIELEFGDERLSEVVIETDGGFVLYEHRPVTETVERRLRTPAEAADAVHAATEGARNG